LYPIVPPVSKLSGHPGVMVSMLASSAVVRGFEPKSGQTKNYKVGICCYYAKHVAFRSNGNYWLARDQDDVSKWINMSTHRLLFQ
jgi:hypothetical protein